jgi:hypothetical protein
MGEVNRRALLAGAGAALAGAVIPNQATGQAGTSDDNHGGRGNPIAVATYSFWRFKDNMKMPIVECIDHAARMGFDGVDILLMQMDDQSKGALNKIKRHA